MRVFIIICSSEHPGCTIDIYVSEITFPFQTDLWLASTFVNVSQWVRNVLQTKRDGGVIMDDEGGARSGKQMWCKIGIVVWIKATKRPCSPTGLCPESSHMRTWRTEPLLVCCTFSSIYLLVSQGVSPESYSGISSCIRIWLLLWLLVQSQNALTGQKIRMWAWLAWLDHGSKHEEFPRHVTAGAGEKLPVPNYSWWHQRQNSPPGGMDELERIDGGL